MSPPCTVESFRPQVDRETLKVAVEVFEAQQESEEELGQAVGVSGKELREMKEQVKDTVCFWGDFFLVGEMFFLFGEMMVVE